MVISLPNAKLLWANYNAQRVKKAMLTARQISSQD
jgi:hypothetical protein